MTDTSKLISYYAFAQQVSRQARYFWSPEVSDFLDAIKDSMNDRVNELKVDELAGVWRARLGCEWEDVFHEGECVDQVPEPYPNHGLMPLTDGAAEGRANSKGIPVLYTATTRATAVAEVRPWIGAQVSVAHLKVVKDLRFVDCSVNHGKKNSVFNLMRVLTRSE